MDECFEDIGAMKICPFTFHNITDNTYHKGMECIGDSCQWWWKCKDPKDFTPDEKLHASISNAVRGWL